MSERVFFEMTEAQESELLAAMQPQPLIYLSGGIPMFASRQERANAAWAKLGRELGFDHMTVQAASGGQRHFSAERAPPQPAPPGAPHDQQQGD